MLTLPFPPRRAWLRSFGLAIALLAASVFGGILSLLISPLWIVAGLIMGLLLAMPALVYPQILAPPYRVVNGLAHLYMRVARIIIKGICFYVIILPIGRVESLLRLSRSGPPRSLWTPWGKDRSVNALQEYEVTSGDHPLTRWKYVYISWAVRSGNYWTLAVLPFLILLGALDGDEETISPSNIYTLF